MATSDRKFKLRNYHARKVAERQQTQQGSEQPQPTTKQQQPIIQLSREQKLRQRSLLKSPPPIKPTTTALLAAAALANSPPRNKTAYTTSNSPPRNKAYGSPGIAAHSTQLPSAPPPPQPPSMASSSTSSSSSSSTRKSNLSNAQKAAFLASQQRRKSSDRAPPREEESITEASSAVGQGDKMTNAQKAAFLASTRRKSSDRAISTIREEESHHAAGQHEGAHSTIGLPSLDSRDKMKRLFASRRRKAQMEMTATPTSSGVNTSVSSEEGDRQQQQHDKVDKQDGASRESIGSVATTATLGTVATMGSATTNEPSKSSSRSRTSTSSYSSRKTLDRYLGRSRNSLGSTSGSGSASVSSGSASSTASKSSDRLSSGANSLMSSAISHSSSMDSIDNHTIGSLPSRSTLPVVKEESFHSMSSLGTAMVDNTTVNRNVDANGIAGNGTVENGSAEGITTSEGVSSSLATSSSAPQKLDSYLGKNRNSLGRSSSGSAEDTTGTVENGISSSLATSSSAPNNTSSNTANGILRERPSYSKEDLTTEDSNNNEKSVRFHMSPLERQKKKEAQEEKKRQCSPPRSREQQPKKAQCSPPRTPSEEQNSIATHKDTLISRSGASCSERRSSREPMIVAAPMETRDTSHITATALSVSASDGGGGGVSSAANSGGDCVVVEEEDMEFTMFVAGLRREVAGDHTELWARFQSLLGRPPSSQTPLHESYVDENNAIQEFSLSGKKKKKKIKMDPQTSKSLSTIHKHLLENGRVKRRFMTNSTQLVDDKRVKKDRAAESGRISSSSLTSSVRGRHHPRSGRGEKAGLERRGGDNSDAALLSSSSHSRSKHDATHGSSNVAANDGNQQPTVKQESWLQKKSHKLEKTSQLGMHKLGLTSSTSSSNNNNNTTADAKFASVKLRSVSRSNNGKSNSNGVSSSGHKSNASGGAPSKQRLSWMEALKKKQKHLRLKQLDGVDNHSGNGGPLTPLQECPRTPQEKSNPHAGVGGGSRRSDNDNDGGSSLGSNSQGANSGVVLRRVLASPRKKPRITPPSTPEEQVAPWSSVQLRSTPKKRESMTPTLQPTTASESQFSTQQGNGAGSLPTIQSNGSWNSSSSSISYLSSSSRNFDLSPKHSIQTTPKHSKETSSLPPLCCIGDIIDLDALPQKLFPSEEGTAAIFPLRRRESKQPSSGEETEKVVIVGKTAIVTASVTASSTVRGKASIAWWCRRTEIRALTLNVEATGANLAHAHGRTPLMFESADVCLDFAQAFYRGPNSSVKSEKGSASAASLPAEKKPENDTGYDQQETTNNDTVRAKSNLTEEEESLLDHYRQFSHSDRTKLRLTCLSPRGDMREVEVSLSPPSMGARGGVDRAEQQTAGTAAAAEKEDDGVGDTSLSEDEEKQASKYRKMLKMGIPPDAVQHKMTSDEVPPKIVSAVLGGESKQQSPKGENSDGHIKLSEEEEAVATRFRKMIKMMIPPEAVHHKMTMEGVDAKIIDAVFAADTADPPLQESKDSRSKLSEEEEAVATRFRKMIKMMIPPEAVRHKMTMEGVDAKIIDAVFVADAAAPTLQESKVVAQEQQFSNEEEVIASKYRKMLKMGVPLSGVEHKMKQEGIDLKIISVLVGGEASPTEDSASTTKPSKSKKSSKSEEGPSLSDEEEAMASKYRTMLKICVPKEAVQHKMQQEGLSVKIMEAVLGKETNNNNGKDSSTTNAGPRHGGGATNKARKTIAFHWTTSNLAPELLEQSIFHRTELKKRKLASINPEESDIKKLEELFQKRNAKLKAGGGGGSGKGSGRDEVSTDMAKLLDLTRANNIAISLKAFNDFTFRSLAETIDDLDPDCKIVGERVQFIPNLLPSPKEIQSIKKFKGEDDKLITAELFFRQLVSIKRIEDKVQVMKTMSTFEEHTEEVRAGFKTLGEVCSQVMNSEKLIQVLEMVLNIGNLMNAGTLNGGVEAFKFESLPKLSQTKSADGKTTVLDYIVETFIEKGERRALLLVGEFPDIQDSSRLSIGDLMGDMRTLQKNYKLCKTELTSMKLDQSSKRVTRSMSKQIKDESVVDPRNAMFAAIKSRGGSKGKNDSPKPAESGDSRKALLGAILNKKKGAMADTDGDSSPSSDVKHSPGVHRLQDFLTHSKTMISLAEQDQDAAIRACKGLAVYCGEEGGERSAAPLLQVLSGFALSLENGVKKYDERVAAEMKKAAKKKKEMEKGKENSRGRNTVVVPTSSSKKLLRVSSLQPSLQPHVGVTVKVKVTTTGQGEDQINTVMTTVKDTGSSQKGDDSSPGSSTNQTSDPKQALLASIKNRRDSLPSKPTPSDGVPDRVKHINKTMGQKESRILLVNRMLSEAPASVKQDFLKGVTYRKTDDPLLRKIYEKEDNGDEDVSKTVEKNGKQVDPRTDLFAAIRNRN